MALKPITVIGGGLAGLTLGIGLRQRGIPVTLFEAGRYPRHRVCGEFINGAGLQTLARLDLILTLKRAGAREISNVSFATEKTISRARGLPSAGLAISRFDLDAMLAGRFRDLGGDLHEATRWNGDHESAGAVLASGRRLQHANNGWHWFGLKAHARNVPLEAELEMHFRANGYVGICKLSDGAANVCGLFRRRVSSHGAERDMEKLLRGAPDSILHRRLQHAKFERTSLCAVAGLGLQPQRAGDSNECRIGDALTMTPPVTGNGMSMAFESAELAIEPLAAYSRGELTWSGAKDQIAKICDARFAQRLRWASVFHKSMFNEMFQNLLPVLPRVPFVWPFVISHTR